MTPNEALQKLAEIDCAVRIQKLGRVTLIGDCSEDLWEFLGLTLEQVRCHEGKRPQVCDFPHDIWVCQIGLGYHKSRKRSAYGKTFAEAVSSAMTSNAEITGSALLRSPA